MRVRARQAWAERGGMSRARRTEVKHLRVTQQHLIAESPVSTGFTLLFLLLVLGSGREELCNLGNQFALDLLEQLADHELAVFN